MPVIAKDTAKEWTPAPEGLFPAVCVDVVDLGLKDTPWGAKHKVEIRWLIDEVNPDTDKPFMVLRQFTLSLSEKATLRPFLEAWRGRKFTEGELEGFDVETLVGVPCQLQIVHVPRDKGGVFPNPQAAVPLAKGMTKPVILSDYARAKDRLPTPPEEPENEEDVPF